MRKTLAALLAAGMFSAAQAQAPSWSGFKAGVSLGYLNYTPTWTDTDFDWYGSSLSYSKRKLAPSIHVGWDTQIGSVVYGAELEHTFASAKRDVIYDTPVGNTIRVQKSDELKSITTLRGRMGLAVGDGLIYATAGFAKAKSDHIWTETGDPTDSWPTFHNDHTGFVYGFGVEHRLNALVSLRAEYQHANVPETMVINQNGFRMEVGEETNSFNFGASFHFGGGNGSAPATAQAPTQSWAGFKAGLSVGYLTYTPTWTDTDYDWNGGSLSYSKRKLAPSIHVGWDDQAGSLVYGAELDYTFASAKRDVIYSNYAGGGTPNVFYNNELKSVATLRGRVGLAAGDGLVYATAGFAKATSDHAFVNTSSVNDNFPTFHNDHTGFVYGLGVEHRLTQLLSIRAEYLHMNIPETTSMNQNGYRMEVGDGVSTFNLGASFHF